MRVPARIGLLLLLATAAAHAAAAAPASTVEFEVDGLACAGCASTTAVALRKIDGVISASVDFDSSRARVESRRALSRDEIRRALAEYGFEARFAGESRLAPLTAAERKGLDIRIASRGEAIEIREHLAPAKYTIFDFWAEWCGPCHLLTPKLERLVLENRAVALRTVDLQSWDSAAGQQATAQFKVPALPYVRIYGPDGTFIGAVVGNNIAAIRKLVPTERK